MPELKAGVVGVGVMGTYHARIYAGLPGVRLVGVADPSAKRRTALSEELEVVAHADPLAMVGGLDVVTIAAPTSKHFELVRAYLNGGVHVLVEKPMASDLIQAQALAALAERHGLILQVGHIMRFYQAVEELPRLIDRPITLEARRMSGTRRIQDIGVILDLMIHDLDLFLLLLKSRPTSWHVVGYRIGEHEEFAHAVLNFPGDVKAMLTASRISPLIERSLTITQPREVVRLDFTKDPYTEISIHRAVGETNGKSQMQVERTSIQNENPLYREIKHFADRVQKGLDPLATLEDDLQALELALTLQDALLEVARGYH